MSRQRVADADDLAEGEGHVVSVDGREVGLFRVGGAVHAIPNRCPHQGGPLCAGPVDGALLAEDGELRFDLEGEVVLCPWHQLPIRVTTGECLSLEELSVPTYEATVEDGGVYVDLGRPGRG